MKQFIVDMLERDNRPYSIDEIYHSFAKSFFDASPSSIRGRLNSLTYENRIKRIARATYAALSYKGGGADTPPLIPLVRPAAIEPRWQDGKLTLPSDPPKSDLDTGVLQAALIALRDDFVELADDAEALHNGDQRPVRYLRRLADRISDSVPPQVLLFRLGHAHEVLEDFASVVDSEWPEFLVARFRKVILQYGRAIRQFPQWRAFIQNASEQKLTIEQISEVPLIVQSVIAELQTSDAQEFIDPAIPAAINETREPIADSEAAPNIAIAHLSVDLLESVNNILKRVAELALALKSAAIDPVMSWVTDTSKEAVTAFAREAQKSIIKEFGNFGKRTGLALARFLKRFVKVALYGGGGALLLPRLLTSYPDLFGWLEPVLRFLAIL